MKNLLKHGLLMLTIISTLASKAQVVKLNSLPTATPVIFLDFDGQHVEGTSWNYNGPIDCGASGFDNTQIENIFNRVAEDYRPFNLNVTTDSAKYLAAPANRRMRVILTVSSSWYGSAGGVAFVGSWTWGNDTPCFVFTALLNYGIKFVSEAAAHEAGHTLGLYHQASWDANCVKTSDYNYGTGSGETGWAPTMGVGYYKNVTTWNIGPNSYGCNNIQNDQNVITGSNGISYRADDFGGTFTAATTKTFTNDEFLVDGIITTPTDLDMFKFTLASSKRVIINAVPKNVGAGNTGSNLDVSMELFNGSKNSINVYNPISLLNASIDTLLNAGTYYVSIDGVGNLYTPETGSLGEYAIVARLSPPIVLPLRKLELSGQITADKHQLNWIIDADEQVVEQILEMSTDGRNFNPVAQSSTTDRTFSYRPYVTTTALYRVNVTFDNGHQFYSNIVSLRNISSVPKPKLITNLITSNTIRVTSPGSYSYAIYDFNGKAVRKGKLITGLNNIDADGIISGMYMIRFATDSEQWIEKLVKQ